MQLQACSKTLIGRVRAWPVEGPIKIEKGWSGDRPFFYSLSSLIGSGRCARFLTQSNHTRKVRTAAASTSIKINNNRWTGNRQDTAALFRTCLDAFKPQGVGFAERFGLAENRTLAFEAIRFQSQSLFWYSHCRDLY